MTIVSLGYSGSVDEVGLAQWQLGLASRYQVADQTSCKVTGYASGTFQVQVSTGYASGWGVRDQITATELYTLPSVTSGIEYFMVGILRDWTSNTSTISHVNAGTTLPSSMPARVNNPGVKDFQPLALVSLAAGDTLPQVIYDLRAVGGPNTFNMSAALADKPNWFDYMAWEGYTIRTGHTIRYRGVDPSTGSVKWISDPEIVRSGPGLGNNLAVTNIAGWPTVAKLESRGSRTGNDMKLLLQLNHSSSSNPISFTSTYGNVVGGDTTLCTVGNTSWQPPYNIPGVQFEYLTADNATYSGTARFGTGGDFVVIAGTPGTTIGVRTDGSWAIRALVAWTREV